MNIYIIAGANGSGKTTFAKEFLPRYVESPYFVNADSIAQGISPFSPELVAIKAGRILIDEIRELINQNKTFAFETTLSGRTYISFISRAIKQGYRVHIFYLWLQNSDLATQRVKFRVAGGGHNIPANDIKRRFGRSLKNLFEQYMPLAESWYLFDNSLYEPRLIAQSLRDKETVHNEDLYNKIKNGL